MPLAVFDRVFDQRQLGRGGGRIAGEDIPGKPHRLPRQAQGPKLRLAVPVDVLEASDLRLQGLQPVQACLAVSWRLGRGAGGRDGGQR